MPHVLAMVHLYPPTHNAGAEWMLHAILTDLRQRGWTATVITNRPPRRHDIFEGVEVVMARDTRRQQTEIRRADVCMTHLDATRALVAHTARAVRRPVVHLVHNDAQLEFHSVKNEPGRADLVVFNSHWIAEANKWPGRQLVVHPPVWTNRYRVPRSGNEVTLLNLAHRKGSATFYELARRMPDVRFLGVRGAYAEQDVRTPLPENVSILNNQADVTRVYERTQVLLMPSHYESWGRCAVEAAASGIPTIGAPTPGLIETGVPVGFCDPEDYAAWEATLRVLLEDPGEYDRASRHAYRQAQQLEQLAVQQMTQLDAAMRELIA